jgi:hypothetical protein
MARVQVKHFIGSPSFIENLINTFLAENSDRIEIIDFKVVEAENPGSAEPKNVFWLLYQQK